MPVVTLCLLVVLQCISESEPTLNSSVHFSCLSVFLSVLSQLCYLHADLFRNLSAKETKKQFVEFYNTFLDKGAVSNGLILIQIMAREICHIQYVNV